jgi:hypothetical protein
MDTRFLAIMFIVTPLRESEQREKIRKSAKKRQAASKSNPYYRPTGIIHSFLLKTLLFIYIKVS